MFYEEKHRAEQGIENTISPYRMIKEGVFKKMTYAPSAKYD